MSLSPISRSERYDLLTPRLNYLLNTLWSGIYARRGGKANCTARCVLIFYFFFNGNTKTQLVDAERAKFIVEKVG